MISAVSVLVLCIASAISGRFLLTREEAQRTLLVRLPALLLLIISATVGVVGLTICAALFFVGGSFYGVVTWGSPMLESVWSGMIVEFLRPIIRGTWE